MTELPLEILKLFPAKLNVGVLAMVKLGEPPVTEMLVLPAVIVAGGADMTV